MNLWRLSSEEPLVVEPDFAATTAAAVAASQLNLGEIAGLRERMAEQRQRYSALEKVNAQLTEQLRSHTKDRDDLANKVAARLLFVVAASSTSTVSLGFRGPARGRGRAAVARVGGRGAKPCP